MPSEPFPTGLDPAAVAAYAAGVLELVAGRPRTLGAGRLVCVDGPAGSGKTTLAAAIGEQARAPVVHMDDLYPGWSGMQRVEPHVLGILRPLAHGRPGAYRRYDWLAAEYEDLHVIPPVPLLVLEGVASWSPAWAEMVTALVWVEADREERLRRWIARDGERSRPHAVRWMAEEDIVFAARGTRERADLVVRT